MLCLGSVFHKSQVRDSTYLIDQPNLTEETIMIFPITTTNLFAKGKSKPELRGRIAGLMCNRETTTVVIEEFTK